MTIHKTIFIWRRLTMKISKILAGMSAAAIVASMAMMVKSNLVMKVSIAILLPVKSIQIYSLG